VPDIVSLEIRCIGGFTHKLKNILSLRVMAYQIAAAYEVDVEHAHLTVKSNRVKTHQGQYYSDKSEYARSGVDLSNGMDKSSAQTWATESNRNSALIRTHIVQR
jgi:hypothetical protein